jgi:SAM-dependent MidA family methyltransferase
MKFSDYMQEWLYAKEGYYAKFREIGKSGDFYTAVSSSMFFGGSIAKHFIEVVEEGFLPKDTTIIEIGAHQGYMLADMVQFIYTLKPDLLEHLSFIIIEPQEENRVAQRAYFKESFGNLVHLEHVSTFKEISLESAFIVANEIFDAFACELVKGEEMLYMKEHTPYFDQQNAYTKSICKKYGIQKGEVSIGFEAFAASMAKAVKKFEFVTFDYGDKEIRPDYSIRVYHKHKSYPFFALTDFVKDEEEKPKDVTLKALFMQSDITYDVNFRHLIDAFAASGISSKEYKTQLALLVEFGIIELLEMLLKHADEETYKAEMNRAKVLIDPSFMGERFKGIVFRKLS